MLAVASLLNKAGDDIISLMFHQPQRPGLSSFTQIFLPFSSLSHLRANERNTALLAEYTLGLASIS
jgi:hypothetical protein